MWQAILFAVIYVAVFAFTGFAEALKHSATGESPDGFVMFGWPAIAAAIVVLIVSGIISSITQYFGG